MYMKSWSIKDAMRIKDVHEELALYFFITRLDTKVPKFYARREG
jgi:hypothetical protein